MKMTNRKCWDSDSISAHSSLWTGYISLNRFFLLLLETARTTKLHDLITETSALVDLVQQLQEPDLYGSVRGDLIRTLQDTWITDIDVLYQDITSFSQAVSMKAQTYTCTRITKVVSEVKVKGNGMVPD